jgi:hypothetical protein
MTKLESGYGCEMGIEEKYGPFLLYGYEPWGAGIILANSSELHIH